MTPTLLTNVFSQGTHSARPSASSDNEGFYYFETDTTLLFQSTGSAWIRLAASAQIFNGVETLTSDATLSSDFMSQVNSSGIAFGTNLTATLPSAPPDQFVKCVVLTAGGATSGDGNAIVVAGAGDSILGGSFTLTNPPQQFMAQYVAAGNVWIPLNNPNASLGGVGYSELGQGIWTQDSGGNLRNVLDDNNGNFNITGSGGNGNTGNYFDDGAGNANVELTLTVGTGLDSGLIIRNFQRPYYVLSSGSLGSTVTLSGAQLKSAVYIVSCDAASNFDITFPPASAADAINGKDMEFWRVDTNVGHILTLHTNSSDQSPQSKFESTNSTSVTIAAAAGFVATKFRVTLDPLYYNNNTFTTGAFWRNPA